MGASTSKYSHSDNDFELAIRSSKELEHVLETEFSATGKGLHEKITSAANNVNTLSPKLVRDMRYLATIRNKLVHERGFDAIPDRPQFIQRFESSSAELKTMIQYMRQKKIKPKGGSSPDSNCIVM